MRDPQTALETHAREELGIDPNQLGAPATGRGVVVRRVRRRRARCRLLPWFFASGNGAVVASIALGRVVGRR